ncbi:GNAT family N-acetyltransferase [Leptospira sp. WS58.C1]|uniref:GNAT family N-acetyltransferase n=1 Tax=Leptospira TaxID=171 RepID=UPI0002BECEA8|nr:MULTISPECIES: GNAT family N-acetyltransferase [unclassified Leptospira]EMK00894.1 acetyltransferase (GNAT) domain protein [Leptospira sp. B5-022]MCR1795513.1 acetyltransferase [Leptospira sp. id769339]
MKEQKISLRTANYEDLRTLEEWDEKEHVIESDPNDDWGWEIELKRFPDWREQLIAEKEGIPIGFVQIIDPQREESHYWGEIGSGYMAIDIWLGDVENLGKGYGTQIMRQVLEKCFSKTSVHSVLVDPLAKNSRAHTFYEKFGFKFLENRRFGSDDCKVYLLTRENWEGYKK